MPDFRLHDLGTIVPGNRFSAPGSADPPAGAPDRAQAEPAVRARPIFIADSAGTADLLGLRAPLAVLASLATHARTETPLAIGLLGRPGTGKTSALRMLVRAITAASRAGRSGSAAGALGKIVVAEVDATRLGGTPVVALADAVYASLADTFPAFVREAIHASRDPRLAAREAFEALDTARRKLSGDRLALETEEARRAGLTEAVLFETAGTQIDAYARANRGRFRNRLAGLGVEGEPIRAFKQLVHRATDGASAKLFFVLASFWAFKGQGTLVVLALLLLLGGFGLGYAEAEQETWLARLRDAESTRAAADWLEAHIGLLATLRQIAFVGAGLAIAANILRALRLLLPVLRGCALLKSDLAVRRRQADEEFGHEIRRVESLAAEVDGLARAAADAERRAAEVRSSRGSLAEPSPFLDDPRKRRAEDFVAAVGRLVVNGGRSNPDIKGCAIESPDRIVVALDGLDSVEPVRARELLAVAHAAFGTGFVILVAADPARLNALSVAGDSGLDSWIQVPFRVGEFFVRSEPSALVGAMLDPVSGEKISATSEAERTIDLEEPLTEPEARLLAELAPLASSSPRAVKRFVNLYRLARPLCPDHKGTLALLLALDAGGTEAEIAAFDQALGATKADLDIDLVGAGPRLAAALASVRALAGDQSLVGARRAAETARLFSFGPVR